MNAESIYKYKEKYILKGIINLFNIIRNKIWEISKKNIGVVQTHISRSSGLGREI